MKIWGLLLILTTTVLAQRPEGVLQGQPWAQRAQEAIDDERFDEALVLLRVDLKTPSDFAWHGYLSGLARIGQGNLNEAETVLQQAAAKCKEISGAAESGRLLSRIERKLGYIERKRGGYEESRKRHYAALELAQHYGSAEEEHDCLISIDVDCYYLMDWTESERVLRESLEVAAQITEPVTRIRAQATSSNNLAGTLAELHNFEEAQEKAQAALAAWEEWEMMTGDTKEFRVGWAHYGLAMVFLKWAENLSAVDPLEASNKRGMAKYELLIATMLARESGRPQEDLDEISRRLEECD